MEQPHSILTYPSLALTNPAVEIATAPTFPPATFMMADANSSFELTFTLCTSITELSDIRPSRTPEPPISTAILFFINLIVTTQLLQKNSQKEKSVGKKIFTFASWKK
jgi:hypothetical protein